MDIWVYVYISELTERNFITIVDHGKNWKQPDGEVFDFCTKHLLNSNVKTEMCLAIERDDPGMPYTIKCYN